MGMGALSAFDYARTPILVFVAVGGMSLILWWSHRKSPRASAPPREHGMLVPVTHVADRASADRIVHQLRIAGIKATTSSRRNGVDVLVWPAQQAIAKLRIAQLPHDR